jgi:hypothetical protein
VSFGILAENLSSLGFVVLGGFHPRADDVVPTLADGAAASTVILVGSVGPALWECVRGSPEWQGPDPIDRYTTRTIGSLATRLGCEALFPFGGPPWHPFQRWARRTEPGLQPSPLGILIHPEHGLWQAYRAALLWRETVTQPDRAPAPGPCTSCRDRSCLASCPAGAVSAQGYDIGSCRAYLAAHDTALCWQGCLARRACPVGAAWRPSPEQAEHHMRCFAAAQR